MQLKTITLIFVSLLVSAYLFSQEVEKDKVVEKEEPMKIDFLFNYYDQDGDHSPVTAGKGTESQQVIAPVIILHIPFKKLNILDINVGLDNISSASTDKIDGTTSSPSSNDTRVHANIWYTRKLKDSGHSLGAMLGFSREYDVASIQGGARYSYLTEDGNQEFTSTLQVFQDSWSLIYPLELRPDLLDKTLTPLPDDARLSINFSNNFSTVINKNLQGSITLDVTQQSGLLSTPFHRVVLNDATTDIERLPDSRLKIALGARLHYYINDYLASRFFYRFYWDDFGISAHTLELELPIKLHKKFELAPFFRYYMQTEADYFAPYGENNSNNEFYTSDYDLSEFNSLLFGLNFKYNTLWSPLFKSYAIDSFEFRFSHYNREDGLEANSFSFGFSSSF